MWTKLSSLVPDLIIVFLIVPLSIQEFEPISTSFPISTAPIDPTLTKVLLVMEFSFFKYGFKYSKRELSSVLVLEKDLEINLKKFRPSHLRAVKSALKKNIEVKKSNDYNTFYELLERNLLLRHNVYPTHTLDEVKKLVKLFPDKINLFTAKIKNKTVNLHLKYC